MFGKNSQLIGVLFMKREYILAVFCLLFITASKAQTYNGDYFTLYNYQQPDARSEAMGKTRVTHTGKPMDAIYNPASSAFSSGIGANVSMLTPKYYIEMDDSKYNSYGVSYNTNKYGAVSFNMSYYTMGFSHFISREQSALGERYKPELYLYSFNYSYMLFNNFSIGFNLNYFDDKQNKDVKAKTWYFDFGLMKKISEQKETYNHCFTIGGSVTNVSNSEVDLKLTQLSAEESIGKQALPCELKIGMAYEYENKLQLSGFNLFKGLATAEYADLLNSGLYTSQKLGAEITLLEMIKIRYGYYYEKVMEDSKFDNKEYLSEHTYGFGISLPVAKITGMKIPVTLEFDYASLKCPSYNTISTIDKNYTPMSFNVKVDL